MKNLFFFLDHLKKLSLIFLLSTMSYGVTLKIYTDRDSDTAEEKASGGTVNTSSSDLELIYDGHDQAVGIRFNNINIPGDANITNAYIQFHADGDTTKTPCNLKIQGDNTDNALTFSDTNSVTSRNRTVAETLWLDIPKWKNDNEATEKQRTPNINEIIQEIIDRAGWSSGNSLAFIITHNSDHRNYRKAETHHDDDQSPYLYIEYTTLHLYAVNDNVNTNPDINATFYILQNDSLGTDGAGIDNSSVDIKIAPSHGTSTVNSDGTIVYVPDSGYTGTDFLTYTVKDTNGLESNEATVNITIGYVTGDRPFTVRNPLETRNIRGNYIMGGSMNLCEDDGTGHCRDDIYNSNSRSDIYIDIDSDASTLNSSSFDIDLPSTATVVWAGLYWQGVVHWSSLDDGAGIGNLMGGTVPDTAPLAGGSTQVDLSVNTYDAEKVKFKVPNGAYLELTADQLDYSKLGYSGFKDVTYLIDAEHPNGTYYLADLVCHTGSERSHGNYGAWSLVVIYTDRTEDYRNITLFDGYATVDSGFNEDLVIDGFLTPKAAPINSKLAFFAMDGEGGDTTLNVISDSLGGTLIGHDPENPPAHLFNQTITGVTNRQPDVASLRLDLDIIEMANVLAPLETKAILQPRSGGDRYTPSFFIMSSELYVPRFCYDYAYKQNDHYFTETNDNNSAPRIKGDITASDPIEVSLYLRNEEDSDFIAKNMSLEITEINATQAVYNTHEDSVYVTPPGQVLKTLIHNSDLDVDEEYIKGINLGDVGSLEYFYTYYSIDPKVSHIDIPLVATVYYDLYMKLPSNEIVEFPYDTQLSDQISMCSDSNFNYFPDPGSFNVAQYDLYINNKLYNIPTQVAQRPDDFIVVSHDYNSSDLSKIHNEKNVSTVVAVELIDAGKYHDINASCYEPDSAISPRIWMNFDNNISKVALTRDYIDLAITQHRLSDYILGKTVKVSSADEFYKNARENTAFRVTFNVVDENNTLVLTQPGSSVGSVDIVNYAKLTQGITACKNTTLALTECDSGLDLNPTELARCMECLYGYNTNFVCSRDNFSTRPESFNIKINDQDQSDSTQRILIADDRTGVEEADLKTDRVNLAAGYNYLLDINATNHVDNNNTPGYVRGYGLKDSEYYMSLLWEPQSSSKNTLSICNNIDNNNQSFNIKNGHKETNLTLSQVGEYRLHMIDKTWTKVDWDPNYMAHHFNADKSAAATGFVKGKDCILDGTNDTIVPEVNLVTPVINGDDLSNVSGCTISSIHDHSNSLVGKAYKYRDYNITFKPYKFNLGGIAASIAQSSGFNGTTEYLYMSDIQKTYDEDNTTDDYMALKFIGLLTPVGYDDTALTNYVDSCFAEDINISVYSDILSAVDNGDGNITTDLNLTRYIRERNTTDDTILHWTSISDTSKQSDLLEQSHFYRDMNGSIDLGYFITYNRKVVNNKMFPNNPIIKEYKEFNVTCNDLTNANCERLADLTNSNYNGTKSLNKTQVNFFYGRTFTPSRSYNSNSGQLDIFFEAYCLECENNATLKTLLDNTPTLTPGTNIGWYINEDHDISLYGTLLLPNLDALNSTHKLAEQGTVENVYETTFGSYSKGRQKVTIEYNTQSGYPYTTTMTYVPDTWLIYEIWDPTAKKNQFTVRFNDGNGEWTGQGVNNAGKSDSNASGTTSRRIQW